MYGYVDVQEGSAGIDAGEVLAGDWPDRVTVRDGRPDIGAYERGAEVGPEICREGGGGDEENKEAQAAGAEDGEELRADGEATKQIWGEAPKYRIDSSMRRRGSNGGNGDISAELGSVWNSGQLCFYVEIVDDQEGWQGGEAADLWMQDSVEVLLDIDGMSESCYETDDWHVGCDQSGRTWKWGNGQGGLVEWMECGVQERGDGWTAELCFDWTGLDGHHMAVGRRMEFDLVVNDNDSTRVEDRETQEAWNGNSGGCGCRTSFVHGSLTAWKVFVVGLAILLTNRRRRISKSCGKQGSMYWDNVYRAQWIHMAGGVSQFDHLIGEASGERQTDVYRKGRKR